ncbi:uncharacterized protein A1O9_05353 [Exophiala aquamarina CBS 119918]|uniref:Dicer-like protein 2 n=1 Tax=Exophiala aquamarina CBS 119918 TaxID=1182545 RepID=A0A072PC55_9EURO|nr:uncharacterized protein A1O9_05353 [Exophiala aquamarina CBS 119918]KEF57436.1 hypothetical protein A1O9_05353 [Exophiala aquamarina CBS 119918]
MAPSVVLAYQQHLFLSQQLPAAQIKLITGMNSPEYWKSQQIWDKALLNIDVVVCTPQILLDALDYGFVSFRETSLIVVDEAHHCFGDHSLNLIMKNHYHTLPDGDSFWSRPAILGLSASPVTRKSVAELQRLEENLGARCVAPTKQLGEYTAFANAPKLQVVTYSDSPCRSFPILSALTSIVNQLEIDDDPFVQKLRSKSGLQSQEKLKKIITKNKTPAMEELFRFQRSAVDLNDSLGPWAARAYITTCLQKVQTTYSEALQSPTSSDGDSIPYLRRTLEPLFGMMVQTFSDPPGAGDCSAKVDALISLLIDEHQPATRALIFTKTKYAAWALTKLLHTHIQIQDYRPFSFVGCSNPSHQSIFDFSQPVVQIQALDAFRRGELNLCIATSVMEEGIDVPAMNLVICFDEPSNLRSFVQSRGRARHQESKFIMFRHMQDADTKLVKWHTVEEEMNLACAEERHELEERRARENHEEVGANELTRTSATLTYENSQQRLQRFSAIISRRIEPGMATPLYVLSESSNTDVRATVHLPNTLGPALRVFQSKFAWRTERMAKRDAAFQAYKFLYESGLVTDNLIPADLSEKDCLLQHEDRNIEKRDSVYSIPPQYDPWPEVTELLATNETLYSHAIQTTSPSNDFPAMSLLLPMKLDRCSFLLHESFSEQINISISSGVEVSKSSLEISRKISFHLLSTILGRRMRGAKIDQVPLVVIPNIPPEMLQTWYEQYSGSRPFVERMSNGDEHTRELLLKVATRNIPYVFRPHVFEEATGDDDRPTVRATKLSRRLDYLSPQNAVHGTGVAAQESFLPADCHVLSLPASYGQFMLLVPSMTHIFEIFLRAAEASKGPLSPLALKSTNLVSEALTMSAVSTVNYQRLEFLGDELLKFYVSTQVFVDYPNHPEGLLTLHTGRIVANSRLQRAARTLGLDRFLTRVKFSGQDWTAGARPDQIQQDRPAPKQYLSSKVLADVIEALIGAAYIDSETQAKAQEKVINAMKLFVGEVNWRTPAENIANLPVVKPSDAIAGQKLQPVEGMIGYSFKQPHLLTEALTHSSYDRGISSYDRLEFLGDAVLDHIVKIRLYHNSELLSPDEMTLRRHALVSHAALSFFVLQASHSSTTTTVETDLKTKHVTEGESKRTIYLSDYIHLIDNRDLYQAREKTLTKWKEVQPSILEAFLCGKEFPWAKLLSLDAPKCYSDIIESIVGAVFVDSGASLEACEQVLEKLGYMKLVNRITSARLGEVYAIHPEAALSKMATNIQYVSEKRANSGWRCKIMIDDKRIAYATQATCKDEAHCRAARRAVRALEANKKRKTGAVESPTGGGEMALERKMLD